MLDARGVRRQLGDYDVHTEIKVRGNRVYRRSQLEGVLVRYGVMPQDDEA